MFGLVPVLGFAADTLVEATSRGSTAETTAALVPVFLIGLLVQVPFALVVVGLVGGVFWLVEHLASCCGSRLRSARAAAPSLAWAADAGDTGAPSHRRRPLAGAASPARALASGATGAARLRPRAPPPTRSTSGSSTGHAGPRPACPTRPTPSFPKARLHPAGRRRGPRASRRRRCLTPPRRRRLGLGLHKAHREFVTAGAPLRSPCCGTPPSRSLGAVRPLRAGLGCGARRRPSGGHVRSGHAAEHGRPVPRLPGHVTGALLRACTSARRRRPDRKRWRGASLQSLWLFGLVPVLGFVGHAVAEPLIAGTPASFRRSCRLRSSACWLSFRSRSWS